MISSTAMKVRRIIIPFYCSSKIQEHLQSNHICIGKTRPLARKSEYLVNMNADIENTIKKCAMCLEYQQTQLHKKAIPYKVQGKPWEAAGANFLLKTKHFCAL